MANSARTRRLLAALIASAALLGSSLSSALAVSVVGDGTDDNLTGWQNACVRADGGTDQAIEHCNDNSTSEDEDDVADDGDTDSNDGGSRRQANEPFVVFDPTDSNTLVAGWNDYSMSDLGAGWQGFGYSRDGGETWVRSYVPGYPADTSAEGMASPLYGNHTEAGDPIAAFDNDGNLYVGGISFNRGGAISGHVFVARYDAADVAITGAPDYPADYQFTRIVGVGTPSRNFWGIFQDKPMLEVDRTANPDTEGNVYVCWSRFTGNGQNKIFFSRSTDGGDTYSRPRQLTVHGFSGSVQGCDISIEGDGDLYVTFRTFADGSVPAGNALYFVRSTDGGASFSRPSKVRSITPYEPRDGFRDCGDGPFACASGYVFARVPLEPRSTADQSNAANGVWLVYNEVDPDTITAAATSYRSAGPGRVGRSVVYVVYSTDDGATWSDPVKVDNAGGVGHQFFPDIDALGGSLAVIWQDSRFDACYSLQRPMGNTADATACADDNVVNTFVATSSNGGASWSSVRVSDVGHQPNFEMFGNRDIPFQGDYNWISLVDTNGSTAGGLEAYGVWTDNRDVVVGEDPREAEQDGFDVLQCRVDLGAEAASGSPSSTYNGPLFRSDAPFSGDHCSNGGGLNQNIYGNRVSVP